MKLFSKYGWGWILIAIILIAGVFMSDWFSISTFIIEAAIISIAPLIGFIGFASIGAALIVPAFLFAFIPEFRDTFVIMYPIIVAWMIGVFFQFRKKRPIE